MGSIYKRFEAVALDHTSNTALSWKQNNRWQKYTYGELLSHVRTLISSFHTHGIQKGDRVAILSENCPQWCMSDLALNGIGAVSVPIHIMSSDEYVRYAVINSGCVAVIVSSDQLERFRSIVPPEKKKTKIIVIKAKKEQDSEESFILFEELLATSQKLEDVPEQQGDDIASIVYTSGTTGDPKGVMLTSKNFLSNIDAIQKRIPAYTSDIFLSILPLSHVLERTAGYYVPLLHGASVAYAQSIQHLSQDLHDIRPTTIIAVPKIFERAYEKIFARIKYENLISRKVFYWALHQLSSENKYFRKLADILVYRKIRKIFGGRLRVSVCGGASMQPRIIRFFSQMNIQIVEGYGLTETSPVIATNNLETRRIGTVGQALETVQVMIAEDKEIRVKGPSIMKGYWNDPEATQAAFDQEGWLRTGDLGFLDEQGYLTIIGRKKDIIVTSNGKNIYPEKIETEFNLCASIAQSLLVGHHKKYLALLVVPDIKKIERKYGTVPADVRGLVMHEIEQVNKKLLPIERVREIVILDDPFTLENEQLTATLKVRRKVIEARYASVINTLYQA